MECQRCGSEQIMSISGKTSDLFTAEYANYEYCGYVISDIGIGSGDYIEFEYCLECGQIQGKFPVEEPTINRESEEWQKLWDED